MDFIPVLNRLLLSSYGSSRGKLSKFFNTENVLHDFLTDTHSICAFSQVKVVRKQLSRDNQVLGSQTPVGLPLSFFLVARSRLVFKVMLSELPMSFTNSYTSRANILTQARHFENLNSLNKVKRRPLIKGCQEKVRVICSWLSSNRLTSLEYSCTVRLK